MAQKNILGEWVNALSNTFLLISFLGWMYCPLIYRWKWFDGWFKKRKQMIPNCPITWRPVDQWWGLVGRVGTNGSPVPATLSVSVSVLFGNLRVGPVLQKIHIYYISVVNWGSEAEHPLVRTVFFITKQNCWTYKQSLIL